MAIEFPIDPIIDQLYTYEYMDTTYKWDGVKWVFIDAELELYPSYLNNPDKWLYTDGSDIDWNNI